MTPDRPPFRSVARRPAYVQVADELRRAIVDGDLATGEALPTERDLAAEFGVSRTTVREALRALQAQGFLRAGGSAPFRSVVRAVPDPLGGAYREALARQQVTLLDLVQFRGMLQIAAIERAALDPDPARLAEVRAAAARVGAAGDGVFAAYLDFHLALVRASGNRALLLTMEAVQAAMGEHLADAVRQVTSGPSGGWSAARLAEVYTGIVDALGRGDGDAAGALLLAHMTDFYTELLRAPAVPAGEGG